MKLRKRNAFTLIELVGILVIMAIIALIATPLVMNIIRKARISADKRSIDAYGRSIELAIAGYLMDTGDFPTSIDQLTIEYSGDEVVCTTTQLKSDSSIYLAGCTVGGRSVERYTYGKEEAAPTYTAYSVGDTVTYNNINYYVIKNSSASEDTVTLLKAEPLSYSEVQTFSSGTGAQTSDQNGYGGMQYHSESSVYSTSYVKATVDAWKSSQAPLATEARLFTLDELVNGFEYEYDNSNPTSIRYNKTVNTPSWVYTSNYWYWTGSQFEDSSSRVWYVEADGDISGAGVYGSSGYGMVRPVIVLPKSAL